MMFSNQSVDKMEDRPVEVIHPWRKSPGKTTGHQRTVYV
jgi:hypothetical protein